MVFNTDMESLIGIMEKNIGETGRMGKKMGTENGLAKNHTIKVSGRRDLCMERAFLSQKMVMYIQEISLISGRMDRVKRGL